MRSEYRLECGWKLVVWYATTRYDADEVMDDLLMAGCRGETLRKCKRALWSGRNDQGLTFSDGESRTSIMVIGRASSKDEYANTISHETGHVAVHIANELGIDTSSESFCYLIGDITQTIWSDAHKLTCDRCG